MYREKITLTETALVVTAIGLAIASAISVLEGPMPTTMTSAAMDVSMLLLALTLGGLALLAFAVAMIQGLKDFHSTLDEITGAARDLGSVADVSYADTINVNMASSEDGEQ